jgi:hypothetical protein
VKPEAKAAEGSLVAPEIAKVDASRKLLKLADSVDARTCGNGILIDGMPAMQGSVEVRGASKAQPEVETQGASRVNRDR